MFTNEEIAAIRSSWILMAANRERAGALFYQILFRRAPSLRPLFREGPQVQGRKLMDTLATVVDSIDRIELIVPVVEELGRRHVDFGARSEHFGIVGAALQDTLREICGTRFDARSEAAWSKAYAAIAEIMIAATRNTRAGG